MLAYTGKELRLTIDMLLIGATWFVLAYVFRLGSQICDEYAKRAARDRVTTFLWRCVGMLLWAGAVICIVRLMGVIR